MLLLVEKIPNNKLLLDHYLDGAIEAEADAISDVRMFILLNLRTY